jgi:hypothetical protein
MRLQQVFFSRKETFSRNLVEEKKLKAECHQHTDDDEQKI